MTGKGVIRARKGLVRAEKMLSEQEKDIITWILWMKIFLRSAPSLKQ